MNREDIIRMAIESQLIYDEEAHTLWMEDTNLTPFLERFAALVASAEREACAKVCDDLDKMRGYSYADKCAAAIRARGQA